MPGYDPNQEVHLATAEGEPMSVVDKDGRPALVVTVDARLLKVLGRIEEHLRAIRAHAESATEERF